MHRIVYGSLALVLLCAAVSKLIVLSADPFADISTGFPTAILWVGILLESFVAYTLVSKIVPVEAEWG